MDAETASYWLSWVHRGGTVAMLLVAVGVGYEFIADRLAAPLNVIIENARQSELERLRNSTAEANARAAEANQKAEEEKLARVKLEKSLEIRSLTLEQSDALAEALSPFAGHSVRRIRKEDQAEIRLASANIQAVLKKAKVRSDVLDMRRQLPVFGIWIELMPHANDVVEQEASILATGLRDAGWEVQGPFRSKRAIIRKDSPDELQYPDSAPPIQVSIGSKRHIAEE